MEHSTRILDLEIALDTVIAYLRKLPAHPETYRVARCAEEVLTGQGSEQLAYEGCSVTPAGVYVVAARLHGNQIEVKTSDVDRLSPVAAQQHAAHFYLALKRGVTFKMMPKSERLIPLSIFE